MRKYASFLLHVINYHPLVPRYRTDQTESYRASSMRNITPFHDTRFVDYLSHLSSEQYISFSRLCTRYPWTLAGVPRHSDRFSWKGHLCMPRANCRSEVTYFKEHKRTDYVGTHTGGRVPRILRVSLLSRWLSSILLSPLRADANDFVASGIPRPPFPPSSASIIIPFFHRDEVSFSNELVPSWLSPILWRPPRFFDFAELFRFLFLFCWV